MTHGYHICNGQVSMPEDGEYPTCERCGETYPSWPKAGHELLCKSELYLSEQERRNWDNDEWHAARRLAAQEYDAS